MGVASRQLVILVADDSDEVRAAVGGYLRSLGHRVTSVRTGKEANAFLERDYFDLVITDLITANGSGLEVIEETKRRYPTARVLVMLDGSAATDTQSLELAAEKGAHGSIWKPFTPEELSTVLRRIVPPSDTSPPFRFF